MLSLNGYLGLSDRAMGHISEKKCLWATHAELTAAENEWNDMSGRGGAECSCIRTLVNKCSGWQSDTFSVSLKKCATVPDKLVQHDGGCTCAMCALTHVSKRAPAPWSLSQRERSFPCTGSFWWIPATRVPTWTWYRHHRWCWAAGWRRCEEQNVVGLLIINSVFMQAEYMWWCLNRKQPVLLF